MAIELPEDFKEFLRLLNAKSVEYLLIGGHAVSYHGYPRATGDMDVWIRADPTNAEKVIEALREFGFGSAGLSKEMLLKKNAILRMGIPPLRIEITTGISGVAFDDCYASKVRDTLDGVEVDIIALPHLKLNKKAAGRHKDLDDLEKLP